ncbi:PLC-like phosphodiesterase [Aspergillus cavernicola]|uniref:Altered inheritance of mitochondria protein 6 n=1 Tax=Aspergillus cavernicola TaxID=176166 RepID=A0ABR4IN97_9EURO
MLGVIQFITLACGLVISFFPDEIDRATQRWRHQDLAPSNSGHWPTDVSRDIFPARCHSHNDYWRRVPLYSALQAGCVGVEADVWLFDDELFVGHSIASLTPTRTLQRMYIDPLMKVLRRQNPTTHFHPTPDEPRNGVFDTDPSRSLILLIDFKTDGEEAFSYVQAQLSPLRESGYLTYYNGTGIVNGPVTVVGTGNAPFNRIAANTKYRDIFFDAPLDRLVDNVDRIDPSARLEERADNAGQGLSGISDAVIDPDTFDQTNSYYASVSFKKAVGIPWAFHLTDRQVQTIRSQIRAAHRQGLKVRYWGTPSWPRSLRNHVWRVLVREGVDMLNVDDLVSATRKEWTPRISDWWH